VNAKNSLNLRNKLKKPPTLRKTQPMKNSLLLRNKLSKLLLLNRRLIKSNPHLRRTQLVIRHKPLKRLHLMSSKQLPIKQQALKNKLPLIRQLLSKQLKNKPRLIRQLLSKQLKNKPRLTRQLPSRHQLLVATLRIVQLVVAQD